MMLENVFESVGGKLGDKWASALVRPVAVFWVGGLAAWSWDGHWGQLKKWALQAGQLSASEKLGLALSAYILVVVSDFIVSRMDFSVARFLEGYWPSWLDQVRGRLVANRKNKYEREVKLFQELQRKLENGTLKLEGKAQLVQLEGRLREYPSLESEQMPTRLGSLLRASEMRPADKYGLDAVICWPRLWLLMPDSVKNDLQHARSALDGAIRAWFCSLIFLVWIVWTNWAAVVAVSGMFIAYRSALGAAEVYGELIESAFDVHRLDLYRMLGWSPPASGEEERSRGRKLTEYLWRGTS
jgi:hypothetical protein